jgi:uncharacterized protein YgiM (DUF1202 family)
MKFKVISNIFLLTIICLLSNLVSVAAQTGPGGYGNINRVYSCSRDGDTINLRARAGQQHQILTKIPSGKLVTLVGITKVVGNFTWQKVTFYGAVGWVRGDFLCN